MNSKLILLCNLISVSMVLSGCMPKGTAYNQRHFILEVSREEALQKDKKEAILAVQDFGIDLAFSSQSLVYRKGPSEYETDFYNHFLITPDEMITEKTRSWLSESGLFKWVLEPGSFTDATHVLEGNIITLFGDFRDISSPGATLKIRFFLIKLPEKSIISGKTYEVTSEVKSQTAEALIEAFEECLEKILTTLEKDLAEKIL